MIMFMTMVRETKKMVLTTVKMMISMIKIKIMLTNLIWIKIPLITEYHFSSS